MNDLLASPAFASTYQKYVDAKLLHQKHHSANSPFEHLYEARQHLLELKSIVEDFSGAEKHQILAVLDYHLGCNYANTEEGSQGEKLLTKSLEVLRPLASQPSFVVIVIDALNQLGTLWAGWDQDKKASALLEEAEQLYTQFTSGERQLPQDPLVFPVVAHEDAVTSLEDAHTYTIYYLAQIYGARQLTDKSAEYCRRTLDRQLKRSDLNKLTWALDCMTLSNYYTDINAYPMAYHCLAASEQMLGAVDPKQYSGDGDDDDENPIERAKADLSWIWGKFYLAALDFGGQMKQESDFDRTVAASTLDSPEAYDQAGVSLFKDFEVSYKRPKIPSSNILTYQQARDPFLEGLKCVSDAQKFFAFDGHVTDYVSLVQDMSQLYKALSVFEEDPARRLKLHKRRAELVAPVLVEVSPVHYLPQTQQLQFELAAANEAMVDCRLVMWEAEHKSMVPADRAVAADLINELALASVRLYSDFITSFADAQTRQLPDPIPDEDNLKSVMMARWKIARLWSRMIPVPSNKAVFDHVQLREQKVEWLQRSLTQYERIKSYNSRHKIPGFDIEMQIIEEMCRLLPQQIKETRLGMDI
ncbi:KIF-1 binding protein C terminal-domain-containing protein [Polychytrium aggregatum]|uniref:KIF-1 binding protein C terminal-domain-containing protein n=1 Tax=Polychytrium aggregatum TaxID=110093 RepID=UPI0022FE1CFA|nr:KIF-1 binding protein C terminal-domain-containing protein [Polychytrium aggregatum]KAI9205001.1 KIF-1 binding protein C terminal-domain-containing protein [Polychytrium aggregatum]